MWWIVKFYRLQSLTGQFGWRSLSITKSSPQQCCFGCLAAGHARPLASSHSAPQQQTGPGFQVFQDENAPITSAPQQTGERRTIPVREQLNRENEQAPGVWTKARVSRFCVVALCQLLPLLPGAWQILRVSSLELAQIGDGCNLASILRAAKSLCVRMSGTLHCSSSVFCLFSACWRGWGVNYY